MPDLVKTPLVARPRKGPFLRLQSPEDEPRTFPVLRYTTVGGEGVILKDHEVHRPCRVNHHYPAIRHLDPVTLFYLESADVQRAELRSRLEELEKHEQTLLAAVFDRCEKLTVAGARKYAER